MKTKTYKIYKNSKELTKDIYINKSQLPKKRNNSTYNLKKVLKDRELKFEIKLLDVVFSSGFTKSIKEAKHIILNNYIMLNNKIINEPNTKIKSGDIITSTHEKTLLNYYIRRWSIINFNSSYNPIINKLERYNYNISKLDIIERKYLEDNYNNIIKKSKRLEILLKGEHKNNKIIEIKNKNLKSIIFSGWYRHYKYLLEDKRIHRLSYNSILWL